MGLSRLLPRRWRPRVVVEVHGDWHTALRLYGGGGRRLFAPLGDRAASWALVRANRVRVVSEWLSELVRQTGYDGEIDRFPAFGNVTPFLEKSISFVAVSTSALRFFAMADPCEKCSVGGFKV